jgi:glycosyltransferase involved in cell wall biosynthesis
VSSSTRRIALVARGQGDPIDAILEHTRRLGDSLRREGASVDLILRGPDGCWTVDNDQAVAASLATVLQTYDLVVVQYNPFLWGRRGFAPWLPIELWRLRLRRRRPQIVLCVHETYLQLRLPWRQLAMSAWQRSQLRVLRPAADSVFVSIQAWTEELAAMHPSRPTHHLPVPSNVPHSELERAEARRRLGADADELVVATFAGGDRTRHLELVHASLRAVGAAGHRTLLLALGSGGAAPAGLPDDVRLVLPGYLPAAKLADMLAGVDVFLAPFDDGVSTRRGSLMAALQHGLPVVGTTGFLTDSLWTQTGAVALTPVDRPDLFAEQVVRLAGSADARQAAGHAARALYESTFDWPHVATAILSAGPA